jgi:uncharacterized protein (DUF2267 family)
MVKKNTKFTDDDVKRVVLRELKKIMKKDEAEEAYNQLPKAFMSIYRKGITDGQFIMRDSNNYKVYEAEDKVFKKDIEIAALLKEKDNLKQLVQLSQNELNSSNAKNEYMLNNYVH